MPLSEGIDAPKITLKFNEIPIKILVKICAQFQKITKFI